jgi:hypothetical protein
LTVVVGIAGTTERVNVAPPSDDSQIPRFATAPRVAAPPFEAAPRVPPAVPMRMCRAFAGSIATPVTAWSNATLEPARSVQCAPSSFVR